MPEDPPAAFQTYLNRISSVENETLAEVQRVGAWIAPSTVPPTKAFLATAAGRTWLFGLLSAASLPLVFLAPFSARAFWFGWCFLSAMLFAGLALMSYRDPRERLTKHERALLDEFDGKDRWIVDISILQGNTVTGRDRGILWIDDQKLYFDGQFTSFALGSLDLYPRQSSLRHVQGLTGPFSLGIETPDGEGMWLSLDPVVETTPVRERLGSLFVSEEQSYMITRISHLMRAGYFRGHGQIPPLINGPGRPSYPDMIARTFGSCVVNAYVVGLMIRLVPDMVETLTKTFDHPIHWQPPFLSIAYFAIPFFGNVPPRFRAIVGRVKRDLGEKRTNRQNMAPDRA